MASHELHVLRPSGLSSGVHPDPSLSVEAEASGLAGVLLPPPSGLQQLVLPEQQPAESFLRQSQPALRRLQTPPPTVVLLLWVNRKRRDKPGVPTRCGCWEGVGGGGEWAECKSRGAMRSLRQEGGPLTDTPAVSAGHASIQSRKWF